MGGGPPSGAASRQRDRAQPRSRTARGGGSTAEIELAEAVGANASCVEELERCGPIDGVLSAMRRLLAGFSVVLLEWDHFIEEHDLNFPEKA